MLLRNKKRIFTLSAALLMGFVFCVTSCQEDPADHSDLFIGKYSGRISYTNNSGSGAKSASNDNGTATIISNMGSYAISFSDGIPTINGLQFKRTGEYDYRATGLPETSYIKVNGSNLSVSYVKGKLEEVWKANCSRGIEPSI